MVLLQQTQNIVIHSHPIWGNVFFYLFITILISSILSIIRLIFSLKNKIKENGLREQQHVAKVDNIRRENTETLENIRVEMLRKEEETSRHWMESEKETLRVLNGVTNLLEMSDRVGKIEFNDIKEGLQAIRTGIVNEKLLIEKLKISDERYQQLFHNNIIGIAYHEMIYDVEGVPCDYKYIAVNQAFEDLTGLDKDYVVGKTVLELLPNLESSWITNFGNVAMTGVPMVFENYNKDLGKTYKVTAYSTEPNKFISIFMVIK